MNTPASPPTRQAPSAIVMLGPQRFKETLSDTLRALEVEGRIALITCGWQEREEDDAELAEHLGGDTVNLRLYARARAVFEEDSELEIAHRERQQVLRHKQDFYRIRLQHELDANHVIRQRRAPADVLAEEEDASVASIRALDDYHQDQCERLRLDFDEKQQTWTRESIARQREEIAEILEGCTGIAIAGGHVASILNRFRLFGFQELLDGQALFAWSAGAMVLTERVVLFHDSPPQGPGAAELLDSGLGLVPNVVALPNADVRLRLQDSERVGVLARRFAPAVCLAMPGGSHVTWKDGRWMQPVDVQRLLPEGGSVPLGETAWPEITTGMARGKQS